MAVARCRAIGAKTLEGLEQPLHLGGRDDSAVVVPPRGFEDTTVSTAADQLKLGQAAMNDSTFAEIVAMPSTVLPVAGEVANLNQLVGHEGFVGIKTGSDQAAGGCLLFAKRIEVDGRTLTVLGAVLGQREGDFIPAALASAKSLATSAFSRRTPAIWSKMKRSR